MMIDLTELPDEAARRVLEVYRREVARERLPEAYPRARERWGCEQALYELADEFEVSPRFVRAVIRGS